MVECLFVWDAGGVGFGGEYLILSVCLYYINVKMNVTNLRWMLSSFLLVCLWELHGVSGMHLMHLY